MIASTRGSSQAACMRRQHHSLAQRCVRMHATAAAQPPPTLAPDAYVCLVRLLWTSDRIQLRLQHASRLNQQPEASTLHQLACASTQAACLRQRGLAALWVPFPQKGHAALKRTLRSLQGLAHCYEKIGNKLSARMVIEPLSASSLESIAAGGFR